MVCLLFPLPAMATTIDLGHGTNCTHIHSSTCPRIYKHDVSLSGHGYYECKNGCKQSDGDDTVVVASEAYCRNCNVMIGTIRHCEVCKWISFSSSDKEAIYYGKCEKGKLNCNKSTAANAVCVMPNITYTIPSNWTNTDVTIRYTGSQSGNVVFSENGSQFVTVTSNTGHQIKEEITITNIDKIAPEMPKVLIGD